MNNHFGKTLIRKSIFVSLWMTGLLTFEGCSSLFDCPDTSQKPSAINVDDLQIQYSDIYSLELDDQGYKTIRSITYGLYSSESVYMSPSFAYNNLSLKINGVTHDYSPTNMAAGGIHGDCPDYRYNNLQYYADTIFNQNILFELFKNGYLVRTWDSKFAIDVNALPEIRDSLISKDEFKLFVHIRDTSRSYNLSLRDSLWRFIDLNYTNRHDDTSFIINYDDYVANNKIQNANTNRGLYIVAISKAPRTSDILRDSVEISQYNFTKKLRIIYSSSGFRYK
jgi:hypothetical protein